MEKVRRKGGSHILPSCGKQLVVGRPHRPLRPGYRNVHRYRQARLRPDVFMQYNRTADGVLHQLSQKNVDTGMGLERTICILEGKKSVYETEVFADILAKIAQLSGHTYGENDSVTRAFRIIADHVRCAAFIIGDQRGVTPSNVDQGYVLRRLIRRAVRYGKQIDMPAGSCSAVAQVVIDMYKGAYPELEQNRERIISELDKEEERFARTLSQGLKEYRKVADKLSKGDCIDGVTALMPPSRSISKKARWARSSASRAALPSRQSRRRASIRPLTCFMPRCARCWATALRRRAAILQTSVCALTFPLTAK